MAQWAADLKEDGNLDAMRKPLDDLPDIYLFSHLHPEQRQKIAATMHTHVLEKDQLLFQHGDPARRFFLVQEGYIKLYRLSPQGQEKIIEIISPGRTFAEAVMFMEGQRYPVSAEALEPSIVLSFDNEVFRQSLKESPETCFQLMATMSQRLHARLNEIDSLCLHNATFRLVNYLLQQVPHDVHPHSQVH
ncbi:MAG: Crp/Fnr family transcriptional regulator, partial [Gammaproteobacteria bacterium]